MICWLLYSCTLPRLPVSTKDDSCQWAFDVSLIAQEDMILVSQCKGRVLLLSLDLGATLSVFVARNSNSVYQAPSRLLKEHGEGTARPIMVCFFSQGQNFEVACWMAPLPVCPSDFFGPVDWTMEVEDWLSFTRLRPAQFNRRGPNGQSITSIVVPCVIIVGTSLRTLRKPLNLDHVILTKKSRSSLAQKNERSDPDGE